MFMNLHERAQFLAKTHKKTEAELVAVLIQMVREKAFVALGYTGVFTYCQRVLEFSEAQCSYFQRVVGASIQVRTLEVAVTSGELSLSRARRIVPVVTTTNAAQWIEKAKTLPQRELEKAVAAVNPEAAKVERLRPVSAKQVELRLTVSHEVAELLRRAQDLESQRTKSPASLEETLRAVLTQHLERKDPLKKAQRAKPMTNDLPQEGKRAIPMPIKHAVVRRDENKCAHVDAKGKRCNASRWLEIHHRLPLSKGGSNAVENLVTLCSAHHEHCHHPDGQQALRL